MSPSEMSEDVPSANTDRLAALESTVRDLVDQIAATLELLKTFLDKMNCRTARGDGETTNRYPTA